MSARRLTVETDDGVALAVEASGRGPAIVLLHGLTATRRYVVMGSQLLARSGCEVVAYDARGHGESAPAPRREDYSYERMCEDLRAVLDGLGLEKVALAGASMGAHAALRFALDQPERVAALGVITPAFDPDRGGDGEEALARWDALAAGLRSGGPEGFLAAYDFGSVPARWRQTVERVILQRLGAHAHPAAVADALETVPRSRPFTAIAELEGIGVPTLVVASRDEADPGHPLVVGERYAAAIPAAHMLVEERGKSPIAWQGGQLSNALLALMRASLPGRFQSRRN